VAASELEFPLIKQGVGLGGMGSQDRGDVRIGFIEPPAFDQCIGQAKARGRRCIAGELGCPLELWQGGVGVPGKEDHALQIGPARLPRVELFCSARQTSASRWIL
jgi:hypothetical protein